LGFVDVVPVAPVAPVDLVVVLPQPTRAVVLRNASRARIAISFFTVNPSFPLR
jgi:hypothetical protein